MLQLLMMVVLVHQGATLQGTVRADGTREPVAHAVVRIDELGRSAMAGPEGYFVIAGIPEGRWRLTASALGYATVDLTVVSSGKGSIRLDIVLPRSPVPLGEIPVESEAARTPNTVSPMPGPGPGPARLAGAGQLKYLPGLAEPDVLRAVQQLPSVSAISDFSSALYVRGGAADQNLITLDGVPLFNPYHLGGIFSAVNADAIAGVDVWAGALPAREGDRLSSAVRMSTRDGGRDRTRMSGAVGLISSNVTMDGPLGGRGSYLVSGRRTYVDAATRAMYATGLIDQAMPYGFWDVLVKGTRDVGELGRLTVTGYLNREGVSIPERMRESVGAEAELGWGARMAAVAFRHPIGAQVMSESRVAFTDFTGDFDIWSWDTSSFCDENGCVVLDSDTSHTLVAGTQARDIIAESELTWYGRVMTLRAGARIDAYTFNHHLAGEEADEMLPPFRDEARATTIAAYAEDEWRVSDRLELRAGARVLYAGKLGTAWLPRVGARARLGDSWSLTAGAGRYAQAVRSMRTDESAVSSLIAYDVLTTQPAAAGLARGSDVVAGIHYDRGATSIRLDAYAKRMDRLVLPADLSNPVDMPPLVSDSFAIGSGTARGVELYARRSIGKLELTGSYAYLGAERSTAEHTYVPRFERRHTADISALLPWGERGLITARATFGTGQPFTRVIGRSPAYRFNPETGELEQLGTGALIVGEHNGGRLPGYFRVDIAARRTYDKHWFGRDMVVTPYVQILNVLNNRNVMLTQPQPYLSSYEYWPQLPLFPTFGVEWQF
ncbi:MAG TPA: TonB-dependent receptor [Longimicrobiales bacterium]|nr:TonB-dependent receptor [Longimicrobiales bacterium]